MKTPKIFAAFILTIAVLLAQFGMVFAAPANETTLLTGIVQSITLKTDVNTAVTTVLVKIMDQNNKHQTVRLSVDTAKALGLITTDANGMPILNLNALGTTVQIDPVTDLADDETDLHPVGDALATFFSDITDYETIMTAHTDGTGFGVIAQALWLTKKLDGDTGIFLAILEAKATGVYSAFFLEDDTIPTNWGQFRKAISDGEKKGTLGIVMSNKDKDEDKGKNTNGQGNGNSNESSNNNNNENNGNVNKDKDKDKNKDNGNGNNK